ncbi:MAG: hypothetical protein Q8R15_02355 [Candidatus Micrarchaeota archaeon]|nr:hypothetical protein [Candidatus Micrarchaeota archaeon]
MKRLLSVIILSILLLGCTSPSSQIDPVSGQTPSDSLGQSDAVQNDSPGEETYPDRIAGQNVADVDCTWLNSRYTVEDAATLLGSEWETEGAFDIGAGLCRLELTEGGFGEVRVKEERDYGFQTYKQSLVTTSGNSPDQGTIVTDLGDEAFFSHPGVNSVAESRMGAALYVKKGNVYFGIGCVKPGNTIGPCTEAQFKSIATTVLQRG